VEQKGSAVHSRYLRFDFSHFSKMTEEELQQVEQFVNERIQENLPLQENRTIPMQEALEQGAMALFGEKYGDEVRTIRFGESIELCGGTHVQRTGDIWHFKITSESAIAAGIRRIEAISSDAARTYYEEHLQDLQEIKSLFPEDIKGMISVNNENGEIIIRLMGETTFDSGKAEIRLSTRPLLVRTAQVLQKAKGEIIIAGHTDNVPITGGPFHSNLHLSIARAASVAELFIREAHFDPQRIATMGFGEYRPVKSNGNWRGRQSNRRVEIILSDTPLMAVERAPANNKTGKRG